MASNIALAPDRLQAAIIYSHIDFFIDLSRMRRNFLMNAQTSAGHG